MDFIYIIFFHKRVTPYESPAKRIKPKEIGKVDCNCKKRNCHIIIIRFNITNLKELKLKRVSYEIIGQ